jgi:diguanylate cyclase (GGDEF)-like protein
MRLTNGSDVDRKARRLDHDPTRRFLAEIIVVVAVAVAVAMAGVYLRTTMLIGDSALDTARSFADLVVATRSWNATHGGVWVVKGPEAGTNPYLLSLGVSVDAAATDGRVFTLRDPAVMTAEISQVLKRSDGAYFRLTSLKPINPANTADQWERSELLLFDTGKTEAWATMSMTGEPVLHYMRSLITDASCLPCHGKQGYRIGDVRGAISVIVPEKQTLQQAAVNAGLVGILGLAATLILLAVTLALVRRMRGELGHAQAALVEAATVDVLTGLATRRATMERFETEIERAVRTHDPIAVIMIDLDEFKLVNDLHGHAAGDTVLKEMTKRIGDTLRPYDVFGRIGGEELLIVAPDTGLEEAVAIAERARAAAMSSPVYAAGIDIPLTVSAGVTLVDPSEPESLDHALARADEALYDAKANGRNRVSVSSLAD